MYGVASKDRARRVRPDLDLTTPWVVVALGSVAAAVVAAAAVVHPVGLVAAIVLIATGAVALAGRHLPGLFLGAVAVLLIAYALFGKGFAYVGAGSFYVGELVLILGALAFLARWRQIRIGMFEIVLLAFVAWGALRTVPYLNTYALDALRDAASWGYGFFALFVAATLRPRHVSALVDLYRRLLLPLVFWLPVAAVLTVSFGDQLPSVPGSEIPFVSFKAGDAGVQLGGVAAFVLVGLAGRSPAWTVTRESLFWIGWLLSAGLSSALNRGAMIAASTAVLALLFVRRGSSGLLALAVAVLLLSSAWVLNPQVDIGADRKLSIQQFAENAVSIVTASGEDNEGTKIWRLAWWDKIIDYTVDGPYRWTGKGYGINLADDDGFQVNADGSLRAPHSANFEFLARSGVPGLGLWLLLLLAYAVTILRAARVAAATGQHFYLAVLGWVFVYWIAAVVNMSVDVYLGGPQGGIWFWSMIGVGVAVSRFVWDEQRERQSVGQQPRPTPDDGEQEARDHGGVAAP